MLLLLRRLRVDNVDADELMLMMLSFVELDSYRAINDDVITIFTFLLLCRTFLVLLVTRGRRRLLQLNRWRRLLVTKVVHLLLLILLLLLLLVVVVLVGGLVVSGRRDVRMVGVVGREKGLRGHHHGGVVVEIMVLLGVEERRIWIGRHERRSGGRHRSRLLVLVLMLEVV